MFLGCREALRRLSAGGRGGAAGRERDRRRAAAEAARKFPMEDAALMALLSREAAEAGGSAMIPVSCTVPHARLRAPPKFSDDSRTCIFCSVAADHR